MRLAAIYDIHGNLPALEAVLREILEQKVDRVVVGGDIVSGPMPCETLSCLLDLEVPVNFIYGNGEVAVEAVPHEEGQLLEPLGQQGSGLLFRVRIRRKRGTHVNQVGTRPTRR